MYRLKYVVFVLSSIRSLLLLDGVRFGNWRLHYSQNHAVVKQEKITDRRQRIQTGKKRNPYPHRNRTVTLKFWNCFCDGRAFVRRMASFFPAATGTGWCWGSSFAAAGGWNFLAKVFRGWAVLGGLDGKSRAGWQVQVGLDGKSRASIFGLDNVSEMVNAIRDPW